MAVVWSAIVDGLRDGRGRLVPGEVWVLFHDDGTVSWEPASEVVVSAGGSSGSDLVRRPRRVRVPPAVKAGLDAYRAAKPVTTTADVEGTFPGERNEDGSPGLPVFKPAGRPPIIPPKPPKPPEPKPETPPASGPAEPPFEDIPPELLGPPAGVAENLRGGR